MPSTEPRTLRRDDCALIIVDMQQRLMPAIDGGDKAVARAVFLAEVAEKLGVPMLFTEQNPSGLGPTVPPLKPFVEQLFVKRHFSAAREPGFFEHLPPGRMTMVVAGAETHVCVLQTVLGLRERNYGVAVVSDAVGSRYPADRDAGLRRMAEHGAEIVTAEMVAFEWLDTCDHPDFKAVIALVKGL
jgi:nicotinamidase-related amidase